MQQRGSASSATGPATGGSPEPPGLRLGVATAGFEVEGGFNGPGEPANNWVSWEQSGRVEPSGTALGFWRHPEELLDRAASLGCDAFGLSVEWARVEPRPGEVDGRALEHYGAVLEAAWGRGMEPWVTLHHFTHPAWLGEEFWLTPGSPDRFARHAATVVDALGDRCRRWVTVHRPAALAWAGWVAGTHPPGRHLAVPDFLGVLDNLLAAHLLAERAVLRASPTSQVAMTVGSSPLYDLGPMLADLVSAASLGIGRDVLPAWLEERRRRYHAAVATDGVADRALRRLAERAGPVGASPGRWPRASAERPVPWWPAARTLAVGYAEPPGTAPQAVGVCVGDLPVPAMPAMPGRRTAGGRRWPPWPAAWDSPSGDPSAVLRAEALRFPGAAQWVVDEGLSTRVRNGRAFPRLDGQRRTEHLRRSLAALVDMAAAPGRERTYLHHSLVDGYEWGTYQRRRGLFGFDRARQRWLESDAQGDDAPGAFRHLVVDLRRGDSSALASP